MQASNVAVGCVAAPQVVKAGDSTARRVKTAAAFKSVMAGGQLKTTRTGLSTVDRTRRVSIVSQAVSVEKELEMNIADDVTQVYASAVIVVL